MNGCAVNVSLYADESSLEICFMLHSAKLELKHFECAGLRITYAPASGCVRPEFAKAEVNLP